MKQFLKNIFCSLPEYDTYYLPIVDNKLYAMVNGKHELVYEKGGDTTRIEFLHSELIRSCIRHGVKLPKPLPDFKFQ
ncbi:MAG: hypothetical protein ACJAY9_000785 [Flavobacteriales bacterium]|jgi:hypothetical protein